MNTLKGLGIKKFVPIIIKEKIETYKILIFLLLEIFNISKNKFMRIKDSIKVQGIINKFLLNSFGVVNTVQIKLKTSIIFKNLHKLSFVLRSNITSTAICKSNNTRNRFNIPNLIQISNIRFMTSYISIR